MPCGQDFNVDHMASTIVVDRPEGVNKAKDQKGWHVVGELTGLTDTPKLIAEIKKSWPDREIIMYPDASGTSRRSVNASASDISLLKGAGFKIRAPKANPLVRDRIISVNGAWGHKRLWLNDIKAPMLAQSLEQQAYDTNGEPDKSGGDDHHNDALGYFVHRTMPVVKPMFQSEELRV